MLNNSNLLNRNNTEEDSTIETNKEYNFLINEINDKKVDLSKTNQLIIEKWMTLFSQVCGNKYWEKNRNLHCILLLDCILNKNLLSPYNKYPKDIHLSNISKCVVKSKLSNKLSNLITINNKNKSNYNKELLNSEHESILTRENLNYFFNSSNENLFKTKDMINKLNILIEEKNKLISIQSNKISQLKLQLISNKKKLDSLNLSSCCNNKRKINYKHSIKY